MNISGNTRRLTIAGIMVAISVILVFTPLGMIPLPFISITISHIPTIVASIAVGPVVGAVVGASFGLTTLLRAATSPNGALDPLFLNPVVSVLPRILVGVIPYYAYKPFSKAYPNIAVLIGSAAGSITNTVGVLSVLYILYANKLAEAFGDSALKFVVTVASTSGVAEMAAAIGISFTIIKILRSAGFSQN